MYTQCPECGTAFRVSAEILKQAAGKVRCGGCGSAFNALEYLSEQKPLAPARPDTEDALPELTPDPAEIEGDEKPKAISAEQSAALLKTLDQLAGDDVRIEDTGVEWRVLDEDEDEADASGEIQVDDLEDLDDEGSAEWFLDESPTPVDEQLSAEPGELDAPELFEEQEAPKAPEEMRFDDHTPLPDDFDFDSEPATVTPEPVIESRDEPSEHEDVQVDLALGEPEDWEDLLGEVDPGDGTGQADDDKSDVTLVEEIAALPDPDEEKSVDEVEETVRAAFEEEPIPDVDKQFDTLAEAMGIDISGIHAKAEVDEEAEEKSDPLEDTSIDDDLIAAAFEVEAAAQSEEEEADEIEVIDVEDEEARLAEPDLDETAAADLDETVEADLDETAEPDIDDIAVADLEEAADEPELDIDEIELVLEEDQDLVEAQDRELVVTTEADAKLAAELGLDVDDEEPEIPEQFVPPMTEEEQTVNMMIDEDLLAIAVTDDEGFTSTIVQKQDTVDVRASDEKKGEKEAEEEIEGPEDEVADEEPDAKEDLEIDLEAAAKNQLVETIIMEGEYIRDAEEEEKLEEARRKTGDPGLKSAAAVTVTEVGDREEPKEEVSVNLGLVAGIAALGLLLLLQLLHQSREYLAVYPAFNNTVGAVYRTLGSPVTPSWDVTGWRFEATKGETDENDEVLTIYSQIGNKSDEALPYPLINISLTDRFEDVIGSKVLEPSDYLAENFDTRQPVAPGNRFTAVFSIDAPDANVTGFKLDVCYRQSGTLLKCAIDDFK